MKLTVIKWRDIPTQVMIKKSRREVEKIQLDNRFMEAVDSAATVGDSTDADAYLTDWHNEVTEIEDGDLKQAVEKKRQNWSLSLPMKCFQVTLITPATSFELVRISSV